MTRPADNFTMQVVTLAFMTGAFTGFVVTLLLFCMP